MTCFRIQKLNGKEAGNRPKGCTSSYRFFKDEFPLYQCHVPRWCMKPIEFTSLDTAAAADFVLEPGRRVMPVTWIVSDKARNSPVGFLKRNFPGKTAWRIKDAGSKQIGVFRGRFNPRFRLFRFLDFFFGGNLPDGYEIVADGAVIARMEWEKRPANTHENQKTGIQGLLGKAMAASDWGIRVLDGAKDRVDPRLLISGAVLIDNISRDLSS